jgi:hypothetical protein
MMTVAKINIPRNVIIGDILSAAEHRRTTIRTPGLKSLYRRSLLLFLAPARVE